MPDKSFLPLARPPKPISSPVTASSHLKQVVVPITSRKKTISSSQKRAPEPPIESKPEKVFLTQSVTVQELSSLFRISTTEIGRAHV